MWQTLLYRIKQLLFAGRELQETWAEVKELREKMKRMTDMLACWTRL